MFVNAQIMVMQSKLYYVCLRKSKAEKMHIGDIKFKLNKLSLFRKLQISGHSLELRTYSPEENV